MSGASLHRPPGSAADLAQQVVDLVGDRGEAQVTVSRGRHSLTRFANSFIHQNVGEDTSTAVLKLAAGGRVASGSTSRLDREGLQRLVEQTVAAAALSPEDPGWPGLAPPAPVPDVDHYDRATDEADPAERARRVADFVAAGPGMRAAGFCDTDGGEIAFANSAGQRASGRSTRATLDGIHQTDDSAGSGHQTATRLDEIDAAAAGIEAAARAEQSRVPRDIEPGEYEVVLGAECMATILIFLGFYGFNAKEFAEGQSGIVLGDEQFDPCVDIWDDATDPRSVGVTFDSDGTAKRHVDLVRSGVSTALVHDRRTAARLGTSAAGSGTKAESTGHAFPGSDTWGPIPSNLFMAPGTTPTAELVASVSRGLLITTFNYCRVLDPKTQVTTGLTRNGTFLIEGGEIRTGVRNLRFTQSFIEALAPGNVLAVGSDARFADSEFGAGMVHCPPVRLASFRFTGGQTG